MVQLILHTLPATGAQERLPLAFSRWLLEVCLRIMIRDIVSNGHHRAVGIDSDISQVLVLRKRNFLKNSVIETSLRLHRLEGM